MEDSRNLFRFVSSAGAQSEKTRRALLNNAWLQQQQTKKFEISPLCLGRQRLTAAEKTRANMKRFFAGTSVRSRRREKRLPLAPLFPFRAKAKREEISSKCPRTIFLMRLHSATSRMQLDILLLDILLKCISNYCWFVEC